MTTLYTIGHSTRELPELISALKAHGIRTLVDIRAFPMSRRLPHFNRDSLEKALPESEIRYIWMPALGGRRKKQRENSPNTGLRNDSFRNYADYMLTPEFQTGVDQLLHLAEHSPTAIMCAERVYFRCHRMLISDYLKAHGNEVLHIDNEKPARPHKLTAEAQLIDGKLMYGEPKLF